MAENVREIGDGKLRFKVSGERVVAFGLPEMWRAYAGFKPPEGADAYAHLDFIRSWIREECGEEVSLAEADGIFWACQDELEGVKKKHATTSC